MRIKIKDKENFIKMFNQNFSKNKIKDINALTIDSRKIREKDIFIPIKGKEVDGHDFIQSCLAKGALASFSERKENNDKIINTSSNIRTIETLAKKWRSLSKLKIIGITGSNGKTTSKELLHHILSSKFRCSKTEGNFNSKIGLPLAFLNSDIEDQYCILEYGASKPNEINYLCNILKPEYSLITNISNAHIGNFSSFEEIANTKSAIFKKLKKTDYAFINNNDKKIKEINCNAKKISFGFDSISDIQGKVIYKNNKEYILINNEKTIKVPPPLSHIKEIILSVYSIAIFLNVDIQIINERLSSFKLPEGRGQEILYNGYNIIDDSYNANPQSVKLAIKRFESQKKKNGGKIFIFADMLELGSSSKEEHKTIGKILNKTNINTIITLGEFSKITHEHITNKSIYKKHFNNINKLKKDLQKIINEGDTIYLKGSRSMRLEKIYKKD